MLWRRVRVPFLALILVKGMLFLVLIPPWLGPDEPIRFEYARLFYLVDGLRLLVPENSVNESTILRSMDRFDTWGYMDLAVPGGGSGSTFKESPLGKYSASRSYPPLFYLGVGWFLRLSRIEEVLEQLYLARVLCFFFYSIYLVLALEIMRFFWPDPSATAKRWMGVAFVGMLPQWSYLASMVHPDNLTNLVTAAVMIVGLRLSSGGAVMADGQHRAMPRNQVTYLGLLALLLLVLIMSTRTAVIVIIWASANVLVYLYRSNRRRSHLTLVLVAGAMAVAVMLLAILGVDRVGDPWLEALGRGLMLRGDETPTDMEASLIRQPEAHLLGTAARNAGIMFASFWLALGSLVYKLSVGWLVLLALLSVYGAISFCLALARGGKRYAMPWWMMVLAIVVNIAAVMYVYGGRRELVPEGRYLLMFLPAISLIFVKGFCKGGRPLPRTIPAVWICGLVFLNTLVIFKYVIPIYYL